MNVCDHRNIQCIQLSSSLSHCTFIVFYNDQSVLKWAYSFIDKLDESVLQTKARLSIRKGKSTKS